MKIGNLNIDVKDYLGAPNINSVAGTMTHHVSDVFFQTDKYGDVPKISVLLQPRLVGKLFGYTEPREIIITGNKLPANFSPEMIHTLMERTTGKVSVDGYNQQNLGNTWKNCIRIPDFNDDPNSLMYIENFANNVYNSMIKNN